MPLADYAHWNEEASTMWWQEEGRHAESDGEAWAEDRREAEDAYAEQLAELEDDELIELSQDEAYFLKWPMTRRGVEWEMRDRGLSK